MRIPGHSHSHRHDKDTGSFEGSAAPYDRLARRLMRRPYRRIARDAAAGLTPGASVLDVGTGPGWLLVELGRLRPDLRVTGVDLASDMVQAARHNLAEFGERATAVVADVSHLPFPDGSFDLVVSSLSLHHWADPAAGGRELARVLRPGGAVRVYDLRSAPFTTLSAGFTGHQDFREPSRFPITPLPRPALRLLVL
jgi:ubiquinone/menaquinone biosynthesis C-methylase UbiE